MSDVAAANRTLFALLAKSYGADNHTAAVIADVEMSRWGPEPVDAQSAQRIAHSIQVRCSHLA